MVETDLATVRVLLTHVEHLNIHSSSDNRVTIGWVAKWDKMSKTFISVEKEREAFVLCICTW